MLNKKFDVYMIVLYLRILRGHHARLGTQGADKVYCSIYTTLILPFC